MIEFSGVRSSCDMVARKADFTRSAALRPGPVPFKLNRAPARAVPAHP